MKPADLSLLILDVAPGLASGTFEQIAHRREMLKDKAYQMLPLFAALWYASFHEAPHIPDDFGPGDIDPLAKTRAALNALGREIK